MAFDLQVDKWGWNDKDGSQFTMNFEARLPAETYRPRFAKLLRRRPSPEELAMAWSTRQEPAFEGADRDTFAALAQGVLTKLPVAEFRNLNTSLEDSSGDPWMRFWSTSDVAEWLRTFVVPRLPRMLDALVLGEPNAMAMPEHELASLVVAIEGERVHLRLSASDARRLREILRVPWKKVTVHGPTRSVALVQTGAVRGPIGLLNDTARELTWKLGRSTRAVLVELLEATPLGAPSPVEDRAGSARFDTGVTVEVQA